LKHWTILFASFTREIPDGIHQNEDHLKKGQNWKYFWKIFTFEKFLTWTGCPWELSHPKFFYIFQLEKSSITLRPMIKNKSSCFSWAGCPWELGHSKNLCIFQWGKSLIIIRTMLKKKTLKFFYLDRLPMRIRSTKKSLYFSIENVIHHNETNVGKKTLEFFYLSELPMRIRPLEKYLYFQLKKSSITMRTFNFWPEQAAHEN